MLDKKATELTNALLSYFPIKLFKYHEACIHALILDSIEFGYLQGRKDQIDKVEFWKSSSGSLKFRNK
ncbi:unnamed protein product [marine sediment metagenome]|uniref:Uncharacterized protein n=1 Tax=marine sediment metagenome TaxID=412755 RepID=X1KKH4_9ZZZZ